ncbi:GTP 3',8-cyclase MoaA [Crassaminicella thermophila]|uniref:GTP 3',8-cyclase n=1 Tax=Crassaminicella thermophila TaxID=2599308 RepID=A0A5C0SBT7_CRATE|nr:GTP 3',8-cyclase MoaA [Crassaminicella thermophila]QEK11570.1 GTP 3',8-cyclase MoaA [Crassaminicella thermophila]
MKDPFGRSINYLRVSVTDLCNLRCKYCMPKEGVYKRKHEQILSIEEIFKVVKASVNLGIEKVRITGGEPLVRKGMIHLIEKISNLEEIKDVALTTNGTLLKKYAKDLKHAGLKRVNISLDTLKAEKYSEITRGGRLGDVLEGIEEAKKIGLFPVKLNVVVIGGFNDDEIMDFVNLTIKENIEVRFIELMPIGQASKWAKSKFLSNDVLKYQLKDLIPVYEGDKSSPAQYFKFADAKGKVGFINPISHHFCKYCNRIRLTADGRLKPCLHSNKEIDLKSILRQKNGNLEDMIKIAIYKKPKEHKLNEKDHQPIIRDMVRIGG